MRFSKEFGDKDQIARNVMKTRDCLIPMGVLLIVVGTPALAKMLMGGPASTISRRATEMNDRR